MIEPDHSRLSIVRPCQLVSIARSSHYYAGKGESPLNLALMRLIDEQYLRTPWYGIAADGASPATTGVPRRSQADSSLDASDGSDGHLPQAEDVEAESSA